MFFTIFWRWLPTEWTTEEVSVAFVMSIVTAITNHFAAA
jgi:hypothetical protein